MKKKTKILYVNFSLGVGGIETLILELCKRLNRQDYMPEVCAFEANGSLEREFKQIGVSVHIIEKKKNTDWSLPLRLSRLVKEQDVDIVHTHNPNPWLYGGIAARLANRPIVHTEHTTADYFGYHSRRWMKIEWLLSKFTNRITTVAGSVSRFMIEKQGIDGRKIEVVYNGIKTEDYDLQIDVLQKKHELGLSESDLIVGNVARFFPNKDHRCLLRAFKLVVDKKNCAKLLLVGDGPLKNELKETVTELNLSENVIFLGNRRDVPELLQIFDLFALSSLREGLPIVLLEAMASELAVVATDVDGNSELVVQNETGILVSASEPAALAQAMLRLLENRSVAKDMARKGRARVRELFTFEGMVKKYENIYERLVKG